MIAIGMAEEGARTAGVERGEKPGNQKDIRGAAGQSILSAPLESSGWESDRITNSGR